MAVSIVEPALDIVREHIALAGPIVFALGFAESMVFLSLLVPSSALFLAIGGIHSAAGGQFITVWLAAAAGAAIGDVITFAIGRYFKRDVGNVWPLKTRPQWYVYARYYVKRYGMVGVAASKFGGLIRPFVPLAAGAMGMRWSRFLAVSPLSCLAWAGVFLSPGYALTSALS
ncbi:MAG: DedA family protein [Alphaproteobacteria bacterium]|nr:DedA family protein [Alphaproteobacteria bacterium]